MSILPASELPRYLRYDRSTGKLFWVERTPDMFAMGDRQQSHRCANWNSKWAGREAFTHVARLGYLTGRINKRGYFSHRVIWALVTGNWPANYIDHIDGVTSNNRIENLREATTSQNLCNQKLAVTNTSGFKGVTWDKFRSRWVAQLQINGRHRFLGRFDRIEAAASAVRAAREELHGEFANHAHDPQAPVEILTREQARDMFGTAWIEDRECME